jgi:hypothetical protein
VRREGIVRSDTHPRIGRRFLDAPPERRTHHRSSLQCLRILDGRIKAKLHHTCRRIAGNSRLKSQSRIVDVLDRRVDPADPKCSSGSDGVACLDQKVEVSPGWVSVTTSDSAGAGGLGFG